MNKNITVCYFGNYNPEFSRNKIYITGLRRIGVTVLECNDDSGVLFKYIKLFLKHWKIRDKYDFLIAGYPGRITVLFARIISRKPVIFNALSSLYEVVVISRKQFDVRSLGAWFYKILDWIAVKSAHITLVETEAQKQFFIKKFGGSSQKCQRLFIGANDESFFPDENIKKAEPFTVVFRGQFLPEAGVKYIIQAAKLLEDRGVNFLILGDGHLLKDIQNLIKELAPKNLTLISSKLSFDELRSKMLSAGVSLGQFENHERLDRAIPHKAFESLAMKIPYLTIKSDTVLEIFKDHDNCLFVKMADPQDIAEKVLEIKNNPELASKITENGYKLFKEKLSPEPLARELLAIVSRLSR